MTIGPIGVGNYASSSPMSLLVRHNRFVFVFTEIHHRWYLIYQIWIMIWSLLAIILSLPMQIWMKSDTLVVWGNTGQSKGHQKCYNACWVIINAISRDYMVRFWWGCEVYCFVSSKADFVFMFPLQKGTKAESVQVMVKVEFGERTLGDSPKVECSPDIPAELNFSTTINCTYDDPLALDEIAHKPVVCE